MQSHAISIHSLFFLTRACGTADDRHSKSFVAFQFQSIAIFDAKTIRRDICSRNRSNEGNRSHVKDKSLQAVEGWDGTRGVIESGIVCRVKVSVRIVHTRTEPPSTEKEAQTFHRHRHIAVRHRSPTT